MTDSSGFVGRQVELARFGQAIGGHPRLILVAGDAGVGKTRFVTRATAEGTVTLWGNCLPLVDKLPLLPVVQALRGLSRHFDGRLAAALSSVPAYARTELARLVPGLAVGDSEGGHRPDSETAGWQQGRLFSAVLETLAAISVVGPLVVVIEDVHWADGATLDCLTYLLRAPGEFALTVVATCRGDEAPLDEHVLSWLEHVRGSGPVAEIRLDPLSRAEASQQVVALVGGPDPGGLADIVYARAEGNPFFTEQLVTAALAEGPGGGRQGPDRTSGDVADVPSALPARLADLLLARAARCDRGGQSVLAALAVAGRPLDETALSAITGQEPAAVRRGLRELAAARLLADSGTGPTGTSRPRHALLAEAVAGALLPGERSALHERTAVMLESGKDEALAAEAAGHWAAAGRADRERQVRVAAGQAAARMFAYAEAGFHFQRAIALWRDVPDDGLPGLYVQAIDALEAAGRTELAAELVEGAYARFARHPDPATVAVITMRVAQLRRRSNPEAACELLREAIRLVSDGPPTAVLAEAWYRYGRVYLEAGGTGEEASRVAFERSAEIAAAAGAAGLVPRSLVSLAMLPQLRDGAAEEALALLGRARPLAEACGDGESLVWAANAEAFLHDSAGRMASSHEASLAGLRTARRLGLQDSLAADALAGGICENLIGWGRTAEAGAFIDPRTSGPPDLPRVFNHLARVEVDLLRGDLESADRRLEQILAMTAGLKGAFRGQVHAPLLTAELALWTGRPDAALAQVIRELPQLTPPIMFVAGRLLITGMRACADLAEVARARQEDTALADAVAAVADLESWVDRLAVRPFTDSPADRYQSAERTEWEAERSRMAGVSDPAAWAAVAKTRAGLENPHRAAYAWWRQAQALLDAGHPVSAVSAPLRSAAAAAQGHAPLLAQVRALAGRARVTLAELGPQAGSGIASGQSQPLARDRLGLTGRELDVLRLLARGLTNAQIGRELYMSPKTASVHVSSIYRKLGVSGRAQAGAAAERAGLLDRDS